MYWRLVSYIYGVNDDNDNDMENLETIHTINYLKLKVENVVRSCENYEQLENALNYFYQAHKYLINLYPYNVNQPSRNWLMSWFEREIIEEIETCSLVIKHFK